MERILGKRDNPNQRGQMKKPKLQVKGVFVPEIEGMNAGQICAAYEGMIDALVEAKEAIECWIESTDCGCDEYHICGLPKRQRQLEQIKQALKKAGVE